MVAEYLNFVAKIHRMPEYPWQCLNFRGTGQHRQRLKNQRRSHTY